MCAHLNVFVKRRAGGGNHVLLVDETVASCADNLVLRALTGSSTGVRRANAWEAWVLKACKCQQLNDVSLKKNERMLRPRSCWLGARSSGGRPSFSTIDLRTTLQSSCSIQAVFWHSCRTDCCSTFRRWLVSGKRYGWKQSDCSTNESFPPPILELHHCLLRTRSTSSYSWLKRIPLSKTQTFGPLPLKENKISAKLWRLKSCQASVGLPTTGTTRKDTIYIDIPSSLWRQSERKPE